MTHMIDGISIDPELNDRATMIVAEKPVSETQAEPNGGRNVCVHNEEERRHYERRRSDSMDIRQKARLYDQLIAAMEKGVFNQQGVKS